MRGLAALFALAGCAAKQTPCEPPVVLAASDLQYALDAIAGAYEERTGCRPVVAYGSTGAFSTQIEQGGRADVFFAAAASYVDRLEAQGLVAPDTIAVYGVGRLAIVAPPGREPPTLAGLADPSVRFVALANPEHAPYGAAAEKALRAAGVWDVVGPKVVLGENVAQAWQLVESGNADAGLVALSVALSREGARYTPVDEALYAPLVQTAAVPSAAEHPDAGRAFLAFVTGPDGRAVLARYGFAGEE